MTKTMYIAAGNQMCRGYFLGDVITCVKAAYLFAQTEDYDRILLSVCEDPLTFLWNKFIHDHKVDVIIDHFTDAEHAIDVYEERRESREAHGMPFSVYKELYPRLLGGRRQSAFCGRESGLGHANIFEYYYYGQESFVENPKESCRLDKIILAPPHNPQRSVYIAPHEKCARNAVFTIPFWQEVIKDLVDSGVEVVINSQHDLVPGVRHVFPPFHELVEELSRHSVIVSGNSGVGWAAGAAGYPLVSAESDQQNFTEYHFERCGIQSLRDVVSEADVNLMTTAIMVNN